MPFKFFNKKNKVEQKQVEQDKIHKASRDLQQHKEEILRDIKQKRAEHLSTKKSVSTRKNKDSYDSFYRLGKNKSIWDDLYDVIKPAVKFVERVYHEYFENVFTKFFFGVSKFFFKLGKKLIKKNKKYYQTQYDKVKKHVKTFWEDIKDKVSGKTKNDFIDRMSKSISQNVLKKDYYEDLSRSDQDTLRKIAEKAFVGDTDTAADMLVKLQDKLAVSEAPEGEGKRSVFKFRLSKSKEDDRQAGVSFFKKGKIGLTKKGIDEDKDKDKEVIESDLGSIEEGVEKVESEASKLEENKQELEKILKQEIQANKVEQKDRRVVRQLVGVKGVATTEKVTPSTQLMKSDAGTIGNKKSFIQRMKDFKDKAQRRYSKFRRFTGRLFSFGRKADRGITGKEAKPIRFFSIKKKDIGEKGRKLFSFLRVKKKSVLPSDSQKAIKFRKTGQTKADLLKGLPISDAKKGYKSFFEGTGKATKGLLDNMSKSGGIFGRLFGALGGKFFGNIGGASELGGVASRGLGGARSLAGLSRIAGIGRILVPLFTNPVGLIIIAMLVITALVTAGMAFYFLIRSIIRLFSPTVEFSKAEGIKEMYEAEELSKAKMDISERRDRLGNLQVTAGNMAAIGEYVNLSAGLLDKEAEKSVYAGTAGSATQPKETTPSQQSLVPAKTQEAKTSEKPEKTVTPVMQSKETQEAGKETAQVPDRSLQELNQVTNEYIGSLQAKTRAKATRVSMITTATIQSSAALNRNENKEPVV
jgi:hypothetical protein